MTPDDAPRHTARVRITSPQTDATPAARVRRTVRQEIDESTGVGEVYVRTIVRAQLRAALAVLLTVTLTIGLLPLAFLLSDELAGADVLGVPIPWAILGFGVYVGVVLLGWVYVRHAERLESDFVALVEPDDEAA